MGVTANNKADVSIIGAGMAGTLLAVLLAQRGYRVDLFERNPDPRTGGAPAGRSVNLALGERGRHALTEAGLLDRVDTFSIPMRGRLIHDLDGNARLQPYGSHESEVIYSVHRARLNICLLDAASDHDGINIRFDHALREIDWDKQLLKFESKRAHQFCTVIGADGGGSVVRRCMSQEVDLGIREELLETGYKELTIPPAGDGTHRLDPNALHIWPRGGYMLIGLANDDGSFTMTLFLDNKASGDTPGFDQLANWDEQSAFMNGNFADAVELMPDMKHEFAAHPVGILGTVRCRRWHLGGKALLIGDAAHAIVPFHGQGVNAAFEDCVALNGSLESGSHDWEAVFAALQSRRIDNANAIADMAIENYEVMREAVRHEGFMLRKALEHELERRHPGHFIARYSLVMFHRVPYAVAYRRGEIQAEILDELLDGIDSLEAVDFSRAATLIGDRLSRLFPIN